MCVVCVMQTVMNYVCMLVSAAKSQQETQRSAAKAVRAGLFLSATFSQDQSAFHAILLHFLKFMALNPPPQPTFCHSHPHPTVTVALGLHLWSLFPDGRCSDGCPAQREEELAALKQHMDGERAVSEKVP